jgi:hypothetical protein
MILNERFDPRKNVVCVNANLKEIRSKPPFTDAICLNQYQVLYALEKMRARGVTDNDVVRFSFVSPSDLEDDGFTYYVLEDYFQTFEAVKDRAKKNILQLAIEKLMVNRLPQPRKKKQNRENELADPLDKVAQRAETLYSTQDGGATRRECRQKLSEAAEALLTLKKNLSKREREESSPENEEEQEDSTNWGTEDEEERLRETGLTFS